MTRHYNLVVIGAGTAAMGAASRVRGGSDRRGRGLSPLRRHLSPARLRSLKMLIGSTSAIDQVGLVHDNGVVGDVHIDWSRLMASKRTFTDPSWLAPDSRIPT